MTEVLLNKPYWVIDFLPEQVPEGSSGQYFAVEEYFLRPERIAAIHARFAEILLKLNCYYDLRVCEAGTEAFETNPAPKRCSGAWTAWPPRRACSSGSRKPGLTGKNRIGFYHCFDIVFCIQSD